MQYIHSLPDAPSFAGKGMTGYALGPLDHDLEVHYIDVTKGHDTFQISKKVTRIYYVLSGSGYFTIADHRYDVVPGVLVDVPPRVEYSYSGNMQLVAFSEPRWFRGNDTATKWNPDVVGPGVPLTERRRSWVSRLMRFRLLGKSPVSAFLRVNRRVWDHLPSSVTALSPARWYGGVLHKLARIHNTRTQAVATFFLRNKPELELIRRLVGRRSSADVVRVAVLGCSTGPEAYSVAWSIRSTQPELGLRLHGVDISRDAVEWAERGVYSEAISEFTRTAVIERMTAAEVEELFDRDGDRLAVKSRVREGVDWRVGDAGDPAIVDALGPQDIVVANNFLCHMDPADAERCLRNIARLVSPGGHLFVSGIDLDVRTKVACELGWKPVEELLEEIHEGDPCLTSRWPCDYTGLEPLDKRRRDWKVRYAAAFQVDGGDRPFGFDETQSADRVRESVADSSSADK